MAKILVLHGPNLNLLGKREPETYGQTSLSCINETLMALAAQAGHDLVAQQSNAEHVLIDAIQAAPDQHVKFILFNPAGYTHTSVALRDALLAVSIPFIEVHLSEPKKREAFRQHSYFEDIALAVVAGHGANSYYRALNLAITWLNQA